MGDRLLRRRQVEEITGLSRSSIYRLMQDGEFPQSVRVSAAGVRWRETEVTAEKSDWHAQRDVGVTCPPGQRLGRWKETGIGGSGGLGQNAWRRWRRVRPTFWTYFTPRPHCAA